MPLLEESSRRWSRQQRAAFLTGVSWAGLGTALGSILWGDALLAVAGTIVWRAAVHQAHAELEADKAERAWLDDLWRQSSPAPPPPWPEDG